MDKNMIKKTSVPLADSELNNLVDNIVCLVNEAKGKLAQTVNVALVVTYWNIGKYIVEFEQQGNVKAKYGTSLLTSLSKLLVNDIIPKSCIAASGFAPPIRFLSSSLIRIADETLYTGAWNLRYT